MLPECWWFYTSAACDACDKYPVWGAQCPAKYLMFVFLGAKDQHVNEQVILSWNFLEFCKSHPEGESLVFLQPHWSKFDAGLIILLDGSQLWAMWHMFTFTVTDIFGPLFVWYFSNLWFEWISGWQLGLGWGLQQQGRSITILIGLCYRC